MKPTLNLIVRKSKVSRKVTGYLYLRLTINRKSKFYTSGVGVIPGGWDPMRQVVTFRDPDFKNKNELLQLFYERADRILHELRMDSFDNPVSFDQFENKFHTRKVTMLADFCELYNDERKNILEKSTQDRYKSSIKKIRKYGNVSLSGIDYNWMRGYETYLRNILKLQHNSIAKEIKMIISVLHEARKRGIISENRLLSYSIRYREVDKDFLTIEELRKLIFKLQDPEFPDNFKKVLYYFAFSCLTGLRISDIKNLKLANFDQAFTQIDITTVKTHDRILMPLSGPARMIVQQYMEYDKKRFQMTRSDLPFFKVCSDQHNNIVIQNIMVACEIQKKITYHNSRHTFATICNQLGLPIAVTSRLMTHKTLRMTLQYAKFNDPTLQQNVDRWDRILEVESELSS